MCFNKGNEASVKKATSPKGELVVVAVDTSYSVVVDRIHITCFN